MHRSGGKSGLTFAQVVGGESSKSKEELEQTPVLKIQPVGNAWLERSAVAVLNRVESMSTLLTSFSLETNKVAQFRAMGGRSVLITFQSKEIRDALIKGPWMKRWFYEVSPWRGEPASMERFVWLRCLGIPLNAWNTLTFKQIGELWGCYVKVDEDTLRDASFAQGKILVATVEHQKIDKWIQMEVQGLMYDVHVREESSYLHPDDLVDFSTAKSKELAAKVTLQEKGIAGLEKEDDADVEDFGATLTNGKRAVGRKFQNSAPVLAVLQRKEVAQAGVGGPMQRSAEEHLMLVKEGDKVCAEDFEPVDSFVADSEGQSNREDSNLSPLLGLSVSPRRGLGQGVDQEAASGGNSDGLKESGLAQEIEVGNNISLAVGGSEGLNSELDNQLAVRSSQIPSINLLVDLTDAACRKRRRRQISNRCRIQEEMERESRHGSSSSSSSEESICSDSIQSSSIIAREVKATMAVGDELGVRFSQADELVLGRMIELELEEYRRTQERAGEI